MANDLSVTCPKCNAEYPVTEDDVAGLAELISDERADAADDARSEVNNPDYRDTFELTHGSGARVLRDLATAVRAGNRGEAKYQLDRLAEVLGDDARELIELGWFDPKARTHA